MKKEKIIFNAKKESQFFRTDENEKDIFYPWRYPGEAFYINLNQLKQIKKLFILFAALFILSCNLLVIFRQDVFIFFCIYVLITTGFPIAYFCLVRSLTKGLRPYMTETKEIPLSNLWLLFIVLFSQLFFTVWAITFYHNIPILIFSIILFSSIYCMVVVAIIILTYRNRGYFLQKNIG